MFKRFIIRVIIVAIICIVGYIIGTEGAADAAALGNLILICGAIGGIIWIIRGFKD